MCAWCMMDEAGDSCSAATVSLSSVESLFLLFSSLRVHRASGITRKVGRIDAPLSIGPSQSAPRLISSAFAFQ